MHDANECLGFAEQSAGVSVSGGSREVVHVRDRVQRGVREGLVLEPVERARVAGCAGGDLSEKALLQRGAADVVRNERVGHVKESASE
eukprot:5110714-Lingulodinium_polyedra.AAC.1